jgi:hypothetical protein
MEGAGLLRQQVSGNWQRPMNTRPTAPSDNILREAAMHAYDPVSRFKGFSLVPGLSTAETVTYVNPNTRQAIVAFRGTKTLADVRTDGSLALGQLRSTARYSRAKSELSHAIASLGTRYDVYTTGHSLGGTLAEEVAHPAVKSTVSFNPGRGIDSVVGYRSSTARSYVNRMDPVSYLGRYNPRSSYYVSGYLGSAHRTAPTRWYNSGI